MATPASTLAMATPASTRWRLGGKLPDGHGAPLELDTTSSIRGAQKAAAAAARDMRTAAQQEDVTARLRALRSSSSTPTERPVTGARAPAPSLASAALRAPGGGHAPFRPSPLGTPSRHAVATRAGHQGYAAAASPAATAAATTPRQEAAQLAASEDHAAAADRHLRTLFEPSAAGPSGSTYAAGAPSSSPTPRAISSAYFVRPSTGGTQSRHPQGAAAHSSGASATAAARGSGNARGMPRGPAAEVSLRELLHEVQSGGTHIDKVLLLQKHAERIVTLLES